MNASDWFTRAKAIIPGGVNSPVRAFNGVGGDPIFIDHAKGAYLFDVHGRAYIDYIGSWGPMIVGHAHPVVLEAISTALTKGTSFGAPSPLEVLLAEKVLSFLPAAQSIRMVNSGTEATMTAIRLARGATGRSKIIKFEGCYHGHSDSLLVKAGSGVLTMGLPSCLGVLPALAEETLVAPYNDLTQITAYFNQYPDQIAGVIVEPIAGNMGLVKPIPGFLEGLRALCDHYGAVLIFDEVMTGFRVHAGGAQTLYDVRPDLTTLGKIIGGGLPVGAIAGARDLMNYLAPMGGVYQAGTLSGNPLAMAAGLATLSLLESEGFYDQLSLLSERLTNGLIALAHLYSIPLSATYAGGMFGFFFRDSLPSNYHEVSESNIEFFKSFYHAVLERGIYFAPSAYEAGFISQAHTIKNIDDTLTQVEAVFKHRVCT